ncbi:hypothetical protein PILCRDRAFT_812677 [Piloderma croceum F 1598]|uniref:21S rRNA pseudouridine(2819) synthase n=1 Tax=Piloderma croceum (strain F 1598) TaxID=765440 RepID=A0A0C3GGZ1_PILCF|nr:hypothetical protein PILCRDRAFT_812677 [Piloderma croceum F 1598]
MTQLTSRTPWSKVPLYIDRGVIVLNKPPGLVCQPSSTQNEADQDEDEAVRDDFTTLLNDVKGLFDLPTTPYSVHRLDKTTTGAFILARTDRTARELSRQFATRTVDKTYLALVRGGRKSFTETSGEIREPLDFVGGHVSIGTSAKAKFAATDWELVGSSSKAPISLLRLKLRTGLKHQLRLHLAQCLHTPILGDTIHSKSEVHERIRAGTKVPKDRMFLHASHLSFMRYKKTGLNKQFRLGVTSPLPVDFLKICVDMGISAKLEKREVTGGLFVDDEPVQEIQDVEGRWLL